eukprot:m.452147 g.452147  ORF g.452147 m.452147 type:complete len:772 (+) comp21535_c0_seq1:91-2406(+)
MLPFLICSLVAGVTTMRGQTSSVTVGDGNYSLRITALSENLVRIEPIGPRGFEDRTTMLVVGRTEFVGVPIAVLNTSSTDSWISTAHYLVQVIFETPETGASVMIYSTPEFGGEIIIPLTPLAQFSSNIVWPAPLSATYCAIKDFPRFHVPEWTVTPAPPHVDPALAQSNGYDFRNNVDGDTYVFLLGNDIAGWQRGRQNFITLTGPTPLLPDFAFGTWFTYWSNYTQHRAESDIRRWDADGLPIDIWALDSDWRNMSGDSEHYYDRPNTDHFPNFTEWFEFLEEHHLRTYFIDHPYPHAPQLTQSEVDFRWDGLSHWLKRGITFWWFDDNWKFSIPPPNVIGNSTRPFQTWDGFSSVVWGAHLYFELVAWYNKHYRPADFPRPLTLNKYARLNELVGSVQHQHGAHHRYPVWWTGDGVKLQSAIQSAVDSGVYDFKPYVHSDCGGDYNGTGPDLVRWVQFCATSTVIRLHGGAHQPWIDGPRSEAVIKQYLDLRYKLMPSFIAGGQVVSQTAFPFVARCDLHWPGVPGSNTNMQYILLNDTLIAPIYNSTFNVTSIDVWIPPGHWQDAWSGAVVSGPKNITVAQPYERLPMWHRAGALVVAAVDGGLRVDLQDWSTLVLECFAPVGTSPVDTISRTVYALGSAARQELELTFTTDEYHLRIGSSEDGKPRAWVVRIHLPVGVRNPTVLRVDGRDVAITTAAHRDSQTVAENFPASTTPHAVVLSPMKVDDAWRMFPFQGVGSAPAPLAGSIVEIHLPSASTARTVDGKFA